MSTLAFASIITGLILVCAFAPAILFSGKAHKLLVSFPRARTPAYLLTAVNIVWVVIVTLDAHIEWVDANTNLVIMAAPVLYLAIIFCMSDLLAVRALGGLFMLSGRPLLDAAFPHSANARLFITVFAYILVICGMIMVWSPYVFRKTVEWIYSARWRTTAVGAAGTGSGMFFVLLGLMVY